MSSSPKAWWTRSSSASYCDLGAFEHWAAFVSEPQNSPETVGLMTGVSAEAIRGAARLYATGGTARSTTASASPSTARAPTAVMALANLAMATGNLGRPGVGVNPLRGQNNVQGSCDMGSLPARAVGLPPHLRRRHAHHVREAVGPPARRRARPAHPQHVRRGDRRHLQGHLRAGRGHPAVRSQHQARRRRLWRRWNASSCRTCS